MRGLDLSTGTLALLAAAAFVGGFVDSVAGGGGLITLPALMLAGVGGEFALGTNKGQSVWGSGASLLSYSRAGLVRADRAKVAFPVGLAGAAVGVGLLTQVPKDLLRPLVLGLLVCVAAFLAFRPKLVEHEDAGPTRVRPWASAAIAFAIAAYDGFFGPGTGTFLILAYVLILGESALRATAQAKVVNFASNLAACALFAVRGVILWQAAIPMAAGQLLGATLGARFAAKKGSGLVRKIVLVVVVATCAKLAYDLWGPDAASSTPSTLAR